MYTGYFWPLICFRSRTLLLVYLDEAFAYTGRLFDQNTGLQNNLIRWYDASTGRWLTEDPIGFAAAMRICIATWAMATTFLLAGSATTSSGAKRQSTEIPAGIVFES